MDDEVLESSPQTPEQPQGEDKLSMLSEHLATVKLEHEEKVYYLSTEIRKLRKLLRSTEKENRTIKHYVLASPGGLAPRKISFDDDQGEELITDEEINRAAPPRSFPIDNPVAVAWDLGNQEVEEGNMSDAVRHYTIAARMLAANYAASDARVEELEHEVADLEISLEKYRESKSVIANLNTDLESMSFRNSELESQLESMEYIKEVEKENTELKSRVELLSSNYDHLQIEMESMKQLHVTTTQHAELLKVEWEIKNDADKLTLDDLRNQLADANRLIELNESKLLENTELLQEETRRVAATQADFEISKVECKVLQNKLIESRLEIEQSSKISTATIEEWKAYASAHSEKFDKKKSKMMDAIAHLKQSLHDEESSKAAIELELSKTKLENERIAQELADLAVQMDQVGELEGIREQVVSLEDALEAKGQEIMSLESQCESYAEQATDLYERLDTLEKQIESTAREKEAESNLKIDFEEKLAIAESAREQKVEWLKKLNKKYKKLQTENLELIANASTVESNKATEISELQTTIVQLRNEVYSLQETCSREKERSTSAEYSIAELEERLANAAAEVPDTRQSDALEIHSLQERIHLLENKLNDSRAAALDAEVRVAELQSELEKVTKKLESNIEVFEAHDRLNAFAQQLEEDLIASGDEIFELKESLEELESERKHQDEVIANLQAELSPVQPPSLEPAAAELFNSTSSFFESGIESPGTELLETLKIQLDESVEHVGVLSRQLSTETQTLRENEALFLEKIKVMQNAKDALELQLLNQNTPPTEQSALKDLELLQSEKDAVVERLDAATRQIEQLQASLKSKENFNYSSIDSPVAELDWGAVVAERTHIDDIADPKTLIRAVSTAEEDAAILRLETKLSEASRELIDLRSVESQLQNELKSLHENQQEHHNQLEQCQQQLLQANTERANLGVEKNSLQTEFDGLQQNYSGLDAENTALKEHQVSLDGTYQANLCDEKLKYEALAKENDLTVSKMGSLVEQNAELKNCILELQCKIETLENSNLIQSEQQIKDLEEKLEAMEKERFALEIEKVNWEDEVKTLELKSKEQVDAMNKLNVEYQNRTSTLNKQLELAEQAKNDLWKSKTDLESKLDIEFEATHQQLTEKQIHLEQLNAEMAAREHTISQQEAQLKEKQQLITELEQRYSNMQEDSQQMLQEQLAVKDLEVSQLRQDRDSLGRRNGDIDSIRSKYDVELKQLQEELGYRDKALATLSAETTRLVGVNKLLKNERDRAREEAASMFGNDASPQIQDSPLLRQRSRSPGDQSLARVLRNLPASDPPDESSGGIIEGLTEDFSSVYDALSVQVGNLLGDVSPLDNRAVGEIHASVDECSFLLDQVIDKQRDENEWLRDQLNTSSNEVAVLKGLLAGVGDRVQEEHTPTPVIDKQRDENEWLRDQLNTSSNEIALLKGRLAGVEDQLQNDNAAPPVEISTELTDALVANKQLMDELEANRSVHEELRETQRILVHLQGETERSQTKQLETSEQPGEEAIVEKNTKEIAQVRGEMQELVSLIHHVNVSHDSNAPGDLGEHWSSENRVILEQVFKQVEECLKYVLNLEASDLVCLSDDEGKEEDDVKIRPTDQEKERLKRERDDALKRMSKLEKQLDLRKSIFGHKSKSIDTPSRMSMANSKVLLDISMQSSHLDTPANRSSASVPDSPLVIPWSDQWWNQPDEEEWEDDIGEEHLFSPDSPFAPARLDIARPINDDGGLISPESSSSAVGVMAGGSLSDIHSEPNSPAGPSTYTPIDSNWQQPFTSPSKQLLSPGSAGSSHKSPSGKPGFMRKMFGIGQARDLLEADMNDGNSDFDESEMANDTRERDSMSDPFKAAVQIRQRSLSTYSQKSINDRSPKYPVYDIAGSFNPQDVVTDSPIKMNGDFYNTSQGIDTPFSNDVQFPSSPMSYVGSIFDEDGVEDDIVETESVVLKQLRKKIADLQKQLEVERDTRIWREREYCVAESELSKYVDIVEDLGSKTRISEQALDMLRTRLADVTIERDQHESNLQRSTESSSESRAQVNSLTDKLEVANAAVRVLETELESTKAELSKMSSQVKTSKQKLLDRELDHDRIVKNLGLAMYSVVPNSASVSEAGEMRVLYKKEASLSKLFRWSYNLVLPNLLIVLVAFLISIGAPCEMLDDISSGIHVIPS